MQAVKGCVKMKRSLGAAAAAALLCAGLSLGCAGEDPQVATSSTDESAGKIEVVCATFPAYDWVGQVVVDKSDDYEVTYLMGTGVDLHSYQPTVEDMARIADADLFVYVGGESDEWAEDAVEAAGNPELRAVSMLEAVGDAAVEEELVEGMQDDGHDHDEDADHGDEHESDHEDEEAERPEYDEHVWLSLERAQVIVDAIAEQLSAIDPDGAAAYAANAASYNEKLAALGERYADAVRDGAKDTVVFADRFPFRYLTDDLGLSYYAAFVGCSAETEASFETVTFLAKKLDELGLDAVLVIEGSDQSLAKTVIENTESKDQKILVMDSVQSATDADVATGKSYLSAMEENLDVLATALA